MLDLREARAVLRSDGGAFDLFLLAGPTPADVLRQYAALTGTPPLWPRWSLGLHQSRWGWPSSQRVREVVEGYRSRGLPLAAVHLDIDHMHGFRDWTWDPDCYADGPQLVDELRAQGVRVVTIIDPGVKLDPDWPPSTESLERRLVVRLPDGEPAKGDVWPGECRFPDFTLPACREWWAAQCRAWIASSGASGLWLDMNEPSLFDENGMNKLPGEIGDTLPDEAQHDLDGVGGDHRSAHNLYGLLGARATAEGLDGEQRASRSAAPASPASSATPSAGTATASRPGSTCARRSR